MKILVLGGSRGLGKELVKIYQARGELAVSFSRTSEIKVDFTKESQWDQLLERICLENAEKIVYCAGGGPFGYFADKDFKDHIWAFKLNFEFPSYLLFQILKNPLKWPGLRQICFVGSAIAESHPDFKASSYAAAKHALKGLVTTVQCEPHGSLDIRLFSPGYMDTALLPPNAWPRQSGAKMLLPEETASALALWLENSQSANKHQVFE